MSAPQVTILQGDAPAMLRTLPAESCHVCITSPPYYALRSYGGAPSIWGGDDACPHEWGPGMPGDARGGSGTPTDKHNRGEGYGRDAQRGAFCLRCQGWRGHLGLEPTPQLYIDHLVAVFREVRRVLHGSGTLWVVIGDTYAANRSYQVADTMYRDVGNTHGMHVPRGLKEKDIIGIPWMLAFALRHDGWWLRSEIVWEKPNTMPESAGDRVTRAHEMVFMLAKNPHYFFDQAAIAEPLADYGQRGTRSTYQQVPGGGNNDGLGRLAQRIRQARIDGDLTLTRNRRSVWSVPTEPLKGDHYAVFPQKLVEPMIRAGTSERGCCPVCLAPWGRIVDREPNAAGINGGEHREVDRDGAPATRAGRDDERERRIGSQRQGGWEPPCQHGHDPVPCTVLDPFAGSGTTGRVAIKHRRHAVLVELNPTYVEIMERRLHGVQVALPLETGHDTPCPSFRDERRVP